MLTALYDITIYPIELLVNYIFAFFYRFSDSYGVAIVGLSIAITILSFPLYNIAEKIQQSERDVRKRLQGGVDRIKAVFSGDEQYMILNTYYKQHNYNPSYALRSSVSLLIQVPFFMAAYFFLSNLTSLHGESFLFIPNLGKPDELLQFGGYTFNLLPIVMTVINVVAGLIYTKGFLAREKVQLFGMALLFLVLLYTSPAGLVLYWTLNNVFSLVKNIFYKLKRPALVLYISTVIGVVVGIFLLFTRFPGLTLLKRNVVFGFGVLLVCIPLELKAIQWIYTTFLTPLAVDKKQRIRLYVASALLLWVLCGLFIPSTVISSSPLEFAFTGMVENPLSYIVKTVIVFLGIAIVWPMAMYAMASVSAQTFLALGLALFSLVALINGTVFQGDYGIVSNLLQFEDNVSLIPNTFMAIMPLFVTVVLFLLILAVVKKGKSKWISDLLIIVVIASFALSLYNIWTINRAFQVDKKNSMANKADFDFSDDEPIYHLSKDGKNVIVFFLDRAIGAYFPYIMDDIPELSGQLQGFTYYPNSAAFAPNTLVGAPALMGGYEYTPRAINRRPEQSLVSKHNESILLLPRLFLDAGYEVTVSDPPWVNYKYFRDYTPFDPYPEIDVFSVIGKYTQRYLEDNLPELAGEDDSTKIKTNLPRFSLFKIAYPIIRNRLYDEGFYYSVISNSYSLGTFLNHYASLYYLPELTDYTGEGNTYTFIDNETPHRQISLDAESFEPVIEITPYNAPIGGGRQLSKFDNDNYQAHVASLKRIGLWLEKLQKDGVYDNTRIIIVADHGTTSYNPIFAEFEQYNYTYGYYNPLLIVKDFDADGPIKTDMTFMTTADTPLLAIEGLEVSPINPFTGNNLFEEEEKDEVYAYFGDWSPEHHTKSTYNFDYTQSFSIKDDIFVESNWAPIKK